MSCAAYGCKSSLKKKEEGIHLIRFPKDKETCKKWIIAMRREKWTPNKYSRVCSKHFEHDDFDGTSPFCIKVKPGVIPSVFPDLPPHLQKSTPKKRRPLVRKAPSEPDIEKTNNLAKLREIIESQAQTIEALEEEKKNLQEKLKQISEELSRKEDELKTKDSIIIEKNRIINHLRNQCLCFKKEIISVKDVCCELMEENIILQSQIPSPPSSPSSSSTNAATNI